MISLILGILFALGSALYDKGKRFVNHIPRFLFRVSIALIVTGVLTNNVQEWFLNILLFSSGFYLVFDYTLNFLEDRDWNYIGNTSKIDKLWRKFFKENTWKIQLFTKLFIIFVLLFILFKIKN